MSIYKRNNMWYGDYRVLGKRKRMPLSADKRLALQIYHTQLVNRDKYKAGLPVDVTIGQLFDEYEKYSLATKREKTAEKDSIGIKHLREILDVDLPISKVINALPRLLDNYKIEALNNGKNCFTVKGYLKIARQIFNQAVKWNYVAVNPLLKVELPRVPRIPRPRCLTNEELAKIISCCPEELRDIVIVLAYTGLRAAELMYLEWQDVNFDQNYIKVDAKDIFVPKNSQRRAIPMHSSIRELLLKRKKSSNCSFIFFYSSGDRKQDKSLRKVSNGRIYRSIYKKFRRIVKKSGLTDIKKVCIHTLRHTFGSHCVMSGIDIYTTSKLMGHADVRTTEIYAHLTPQYMQNAINKLDYNFLEKYDQNNFEAPIKLTARHLAV